MTQILHSVQDDSTCPVSQILHSAKGSIQDDKRSDSIQGGRWIAPLSSRFFS